jgi:exopolysaccharide biosynthesis polyprenyl glycosylphosphotransferase
MNEVTTLKPAAAGPATRANGPASEPPEASETRAALTPALVSGSGLRIEAPAARALEQPAAPNRRDALFRRLLAGADLGAAAGGLTVLAALSPGHSSAAGFLCLPLIVIMAKASGRYDHDDLVLRKSTLDEMPSLLTLAAGFTLAWSLVAFLARLRGGLGGGEAIVLWASTSALLVGLRMAARLVGQRSAPPERVLIVGQASARASLAQAIASDPGAHVEVVGFLPLEDERRSDIWVGRSRRQRSLGFHDVESVVREQQIDRVLLLPTSADSELMLDAVRRTTGLGVKVSIIPRLFEVIGSTVEFDSVGGVTVLGVRRAGLSRSSKAVKRLMDVAGSLIGLIALAPIGGLVAMAIKLDSAGPVFFCQRRVGRDGRTFRMVKFRSMIDGADAQRAALAARNETSGLFKISDDPRVTRVGRWLRRTSIDELPQLINVLRGEMSLVGPRPLILDEDRLVEGRHRARLQLAPGMTGPWQVLGPRRPPLGEMVKTDYLYAANWSLWSDVKIILRTIGHVFARRGL